ncbi:MAG: VanZ family protein [Geminicoccaceae bacterium]
MSDIIETGSKRRRSKAEKAHDGAIGKKRKIDRSKDELELGRFSGEIGRLPGPDAAAPGTPAGQGEVVGPKRRKVDANEPAARKREPGGALQIAAPLALDDEPATHRPRVSRRSKPDSGSRWARRALLAALSVVLITLTAATFLLLPRYEFNAAPLIADPAFENTFADWDGAGLIVADPDDPGRIVLESVDAGARTSLVRDFALPPGRNILVLRAQVQGDNVVPGPEIWDSARIYLAQLDADGEPNWRADHNVFTLYGTTEVRNYSRAFSISSDVETIRVGIELKNSTGRLTVGNLQLSEAERPTIFLIATGFLLVAWTALILYAAYRTLRGIESMRIRMALGVTCALSAVSLMLPGYVYEETLFVMLHGAGLEALDVDSLGHATMFALLAFLVRTGRPADPLWLHACAWALIAVASEVLQLFTVDREPSLADLALDGLGVLLGFALAEVLRRMQRSEPA